MRAWPTEHDSLLGYWHQYHLWQSNLEECQNHLSNDFRRCNFPGAAGYEAIKGARLEVESNGKCPTRDEEIHLYGKVGDRLLMWRESLRNCQIYVYELASDPDNSWILETPTCLNRAIQD